MCNRFFYRCRDCLTVVAAEERVFDAACGLCNGTMEFMGKVERDRLVKEGFECLCDYRCTSARGPSCNCKCGGMNHGSNMVVRVKRDAGAAPVLETPNSWKAKAVAEEWRGAVDQVCGQLQRLGQGWLPEEEFRRKLALGRALNSARKRREHKSRMKLLQPYLPQAEPAFSLANDPPAHQPQQFDNAEHTRQKPLIDGMACLPGQLDLF